MNEQVKYVYTAHFYASRMEIPLLRHFTCGDLYVRDTIISHTPGILLR